ncbi:linear amide C-N hydrolase [Corallococcus terminator]
MCTGIVLTAKDESVIYGRTMEWASFDLVSRLAVVPPGTAFQGSTPNPKQTGISWSSKLAFVGIDALEKQIFTDGLNEAGLACGFFYHPGFASYETYDPNKAHVTLSAGELVQYILGNFSALKEVREALPKLHVPPVVEHAIKMAPPGHLMIVEASGKAIVVEFLNGKMHFFDAPLRVITNAPEYSWHMTNLRNYVNLSPVSLPEGELEGINFAPLGVGSGMIGLPGDYTPPSRFVRAVAFSQTARATRDAEETVYELLRILDGFNLPLAPGEGYQGTGERTAHDLRSSTQWTTASDTRNLIFYFHTQDNRRVRKISLKDVDFNALDKKILYVPLDTRKAQDIEDRTPRRQPRAV